ncbi:MAG: hypothetical protein KJ040_08670 [Gammaproteobacteria bacterium]|nr:hypothetical protein [Gammaproteobacteria bacterium]
MISTLEYGVLARNAYNFTDNNVIRLPGWDPVKIVDGWGGFSATVYQKGPGGEIVISFRGTDGESIDWDLIWERLQA